MRTTTEILNHHLQCFANRDLDGIMSDYSPDAVFLSADGAVRGHSPIRAVFKKLFTEFGKPGASLSSKQRVVEGDYVYLLWTAETPDNSYELASDTFVIHGDQIRMQALTAKVRTKH